MTDSSHEHPAARASNSGPGALIRRAREAAKLSVEDLAAQLKLSRHTLDALERDDFAVLTESVYVRGYYRKLSKVLPLSETELIGQYDSMAAPRATVAPSKIILTGNQDLSPVSPWNKALVLTGMVVTALVIALTAFWASRRSEPAVEPAVVMPAEPAPVAPPTPSPQAAVPQPNPAPAPAPATGLDTMVAAAPAPVTAVAEPAPVPVAAGQAQLSLEYSQDCWTRIQDADGTTIVSGIIPAGEKLNYAGKPPFAIILGRAAAVQMKLNGTPVDMTAFTLSSGKASFSLP